MCIGTVGIVTAERHESTYGTYGLVKSLRGLLTLSLSGWY